LLRTAWPRTTIIRLTRRTAVSAELENIQNNTIEDIIQGKKVQLYAITADPQP